MKRKDYQKPTMKVVKLQQQERLMAGSVQSTSNTVKDYYWKTEVEEKNHGDRLFEVNSLNSLQTTCPHDPPMIHAESLGQLDETPFPLPASCVIGTSPVAEYDRYGHRSQPLPLQSERSTTLCDHAPCATMHSRAIEGSEGSEGSKCKKYDQKFGGFE